MSKRLIAVVLGVLLLGGCGVGAPEPTEVEHGVKVGSDDYVQVVEVEGITCVVITGFRSSGIDCDFD